MLKRLAQDRLDTDVNLKHEKAFIGKLKIWHKQEMRVNAYQMQKVDQQMMQFKRKSEKYEASNRGLIEL
jgi:hypothetical protein